MAQPERLHPQEGRGQHETIGEAAGNLVSDIADLIRSEIQLARSEIVGDVGALGRGGALLVVGGAVAYLGLALLLVAALFALEYLMEPWLAAVIVGVIVLVVGGVLAWLGYKRLKSITPVPERTIASLREDVAWLRNPKR